MSKQIELMMKHLAFEICKIETKMLADSTYKSCLLQKSFVALLTNMAE